MPAPTTTSLGLSLGTCPPGSPLAPAIASYRCYAWGDSRTVGGHGQVTADSWRQALYEMALSSLGVTITAVGTTASTAPNWGLHRAVNGVTLATLLSGLQADPTTLLTNPDPDVVMLCPVGINDLIGGTSGADTVELLRQFLEILRPFTNARGVSPRVVCSYEYYHSGQSASGRVDDFNAALPAMIATQVGLGQKVVLIDPRPAVNHTVWLHPDGNTYDVLAQVVFRGFCNAIGMDAQWGRPTS